MQDHVFVIGSMASGKSTIGVLTAALIGRDFLDNDVLLVRETGKKAAEIFATEGREVLHEKENAAVIAAAASLGPSVIALPGSFIENAAVVELVESGSVIYLRARPETLRARLGGGERPLSEPAADELERLDALRRSRYGEIADLVIDVDEIAPKAIAAKIVSFLTRVVTVPLAERSYEVLVGPGTRASIGTVLPKSARRAVVVTSPGVPVELAVPLETTLVSVPDGEAAKTIAVVESLCRSFVGAGLNRGDVVVSLGGGAVSDVAGFAASCYHRGVAVAHVSTTLLGQIDAAVGGKTGVNLPEGKNLVGSFYQPCGVICDTDVLFSLPEREWRSGLGELAKYAFLGVEGLEELHLVDQVARCIEKKAQIVSGDEREEGNRAVLNYGHTLAHALEAETFSGTIDDVRHGEAVAIGLVFAALLAHRLGRIDAARVARHYEVLSAYGLSGALPAGTDRDELVAAMARDKKATSGLTFVLDGPKGPEVVAEVPVEVVRATLGELAEADHLEATGRVATGPR